MNFYLFDIDGVLLEPLGYHYALVETIRLIANSLGYGDILLTAEDIAAFESSGVSSEWDLTDICAAFLLVQAWKIDPDLRLPTTTGKPAAQPPQTPQDFLALWHVGKSRIEPDTPAGTRQPNSA